MYLNQISCLTQMKSCSEANLILCGSRVGLCQTRPHVRPKIRKFKSSTRSGKYFKDCPSASNRKRTTSGTNLSRTFSLRRTVSADQYESPRHFKQNFRTAKNNPGEDAGSSNEDKVERNKTDDKPEIDESLKNTCQSNRQHPEAALEVTLLTQAHEDVYNQKKHSKSAELLGQLTHGHIKELYCNTPKYKNNKDSLHVELKEISTYLDKTKENDVITVETDIQDIVRDVDDKQLASVEDQVNVPGNVVESQRFKSTTEMDEAVIPTGICASRQVYCSFNGTLPKDKNGESTLLEKHFLERKIESEESVLNKDYNTKVSSFTSEGQESLSAEQQKIVLTNCSENNIQNVNFGSHQAGDQVTITPILSGENKTAFSSNLREMDAFHQNTVFSESMEKEDSSHQNISKITGSIANLNHSTEDKSDFNACEESRLITGKSKHPSLSCRDNLTSNNSSLLCDGFSGYAGQIKLEETGSNITWTEATQYQEEVSKQQSKENMCVKYKNYQLHSSTNEKSYLNNQTDLHISGRRGLKQGYNYIFITPTLLPKCETIEGMEHKVLPSSVENEKHNSKNMDLHEKDKNGYSGSTYEGVLEILDLLEQEERECRFRVENSVDQVAQPSCEKYRSIVAYLEDIEREDQQRKCEIQLSETTEATRQKNTETDLDLQKLWGLQTEVEQKDKTIEVLHKLLTHQKDILKQQSKDLETEAKQKLDFQKQHYDATVQRHQTFIDQLIKDKKELTEKYEEVLLALKSSESKYAAKIKAQAERHAVDLQKTKALAAASEKITREKWISNQKKRIKEMTVKGLEPEIKQLMKSHHQELEQMKEAHQVELIQVEEKISSYYKHKMDQFREQLCREKEDACLQERELARERFEKQLEREETTFQQLRRRLHCSFEEEKEQLVQEISWIKKEQLQKLKELNERKQEEIVTLQNQFIQEKEKLKIDHEFKIKMLQEKLDKKHDAWEKEKNEEFAVLLEKREKDIKEQMEIEREMENEMVTNHLKEKVKLTKEECEQVAEVKLRKLTQKYEEKVKDLELSQNSILSKYNKVKCQLTELEDEKFQLESTVKYKATEVLELKQRNESLMKERENVTDIIRQEFSADLEQLRKEKEGLAKKIQQQKQLHEQELQKLMLDLKLAKISNEETLEELDNRVRHTLSKKETVISQLSLKLEASKTRANHLEKLLEKQRQELLGT